MPLDHVKSTILYASIAAESLPKWQFCHHQITELSLLSVLLVTEVTELSFLHMFLELKLVKWQFFFYCFKSAIWNPSIFFLQVGNVITYMQKKKKEMPLNSKAVKKHIFWKSDASVTSIISATSDIQQKFHKWQFCHFWNRFHSGILVCGNCVALLEN